MPDGDEAITQLNRGGYAQSINVSDTSNCCSAALLDTEIVVAAEPTTIIAIAATRQQYAPQPLEAGRSGGEAERAFLDSSHGREGRSEFSAAATTTGSETIAAASAASAVTANHVGGTAEPRCFLARQSRTLLLDNPPDGGGVLIRTAAR
ncbi:unnamed protein product [Ceratitis capitata]|uniref:(Mediterranean fruit fly) hypothetical protein n=1 Tax=Ceratitis capitata TaxID=7213 RepID=A0A811VJG8_CERCA|nr:unnamed protein product [Ceratitis capitata]